MDICRVLACARLCAVCEWSACAFQERACKYPGVNPKAFVQTSEHTRLRAGGEGGGQERGGRHRAQHLLLHEFIQKHFSLPAHLHHFGDN